MEMIFSPLIVGTMRWGSWGQNYDKKEIQNLIETALDLGLYTFDLADIYGGYTSERDFGNALKEMNLPRESYQLITKCGIKYKGGEKPYEIKSYDLSKDYILKCVDESLEKLSTPYLDLLLLHRPSPLMDGEEIAAAFSLLRSSGKVKNFGVSNFSVMEMDYLLGYVGDLITNQIEISLSKPEAFFDSRLLQMQKLKLQPTAWSPTGTYFSLESEQNTRIKSELVRLGQKYDASEGELLLAFLLKHPSRIVPVVGTSKSSTLQTLSKASSVELSTEDWFYLLEASRGVKVP